MTEPRLLGVAGFPVGHSRSPDMHSAALRELGLPWRYLRLPLPSELFAETVRALPAAGYLGVNVTVPHKPAALEVADRLTPAAEGVGAANTLTFAEGAIEADNTDAAGFADALGQPPEGLTALVLGAGGAARAVVWALVEGGARDILVWNRTPERARVLVAQLGGRAVERPRSAELVVNATSIGLDPATTEEEAVAALDLEGVERPAAFVDLVYGPGAGALRGWAKAGGSRTVGGLEVLVRQGALSLERWTGGDAPLAVMRRAVGIGPPALR